MGCELFHRTKTYEKATLSWGLGAIVVCIDTIVAWCWTAIDVRSGNAPTIGYSEAMGDDAKSTDGLTIVPSSFGVGNNGST
jgi:hypothetical protein